MTPPGPERVVVGLDVGTTGVKAAAFGVGTPWRSFAIREYPLISPRLDEEVEDPQAILVATADALAECVSSTDGAHVVAISVSRGHARPARPRPRPPPADPPDHLG